MKKIFGPTWLAFLAIIMLMSPASAQQLHMVTVAMSPVGPSVDKSGYIELIAREAFGRVGVEIDVTTLPGERALINVNSGLDDGDLFRTRGIEKAYPNLIRIPEKVLDLEFLAFTRNNDIQIKSFADLKSHSVAYVTGWKIFENSVKEAREIITVRGVPDLFTLLEKGRSDVVLATRWSGLWAARQADIKVKVQQPPLKISEMYIYLNKRHAALVPEVAKALVAMKRDGTFQRIMNQTLKPLETR